MAQETKNGPDLQIRGLTVGQLCRQLGIDRERFLISCSFQHLVNHAVRSPCRLPIKLGRDGSQTRAARRAEGSVVPLIAASNGSTASLASFSPSLAGTAPKP